MGKAEFLIAPSNSCLIPQRENDGLLNTTRVSYSSFHRGEAVFFFILHIWCKAWFSVAPRASGVPVWLPSPRAPASGLVVAPALGPRLPPSSAGPPSGDWLTGGCREVSWRITVGFTSLPYVPSGASEDRRGQWNGEEKEERKTQVREEESPWKCRGIVEKCRWLDACGCLVCVAPQHSVLHGLPTWNFLCCGSWEVFCFV